MTDDLRYAYAFIHHTVKDMLIRTAYAAISDLDLDLALTGSHFCTCCEFKFFVAVIVCCFHFSIFPVVTNARPVGAYCLPGH